MGIRSLKINDNLTTPERYIKLSGRSSYRNSSLIPTYTSISENGILPDTKKDDWFLNKLKKEHLEEFTPIDLYNGRFNEITILHKTCNKTFKDTPHNFLRRKNKCPHCDNLLIFRRSKNDESIKKSAIQKKMDSIHNGEFKFIRISPSDNFLVEIEHINCKRQFTDYRRKLYTKELECPHCSKGRFKNKFISSKDKIEYYQNKLEGKFIILENFVTQKDKIKLKRISCGHIITKSLNELLRKDYKDSCPECKRLERLDSLNKKLDKQYNGRIKVVNGIEKYQNNQTKLLFFDNRCKNNFYSTFTNLLSYKMDKCPSCTNSIKHEVYNKYKGEYIALEEYTNSTTPILFKHTKCNHVFRKTKSKFFNA